MQVIVESLARNANKNENPVKEYAQQALLKNGNRSSID